MLRTTDEAFKRMQAEQEELQNKIDKLEAFIKKCRQNKVQNITIDDIHLLEEQLKYMRGYNGVLQCRIGRVEHNEEKKKIKKVLTTMHNICVKNEYCCDCPLHNRIFLNTEDIDDNDLNITTNIIKEIIDSEQNKNIT